MHSKHFDFTPSIFLGSGLNCCEFGAEVCQQITLVLFFRFLGGIIHFVYLRQDLFMHHFNPRQRFVVLSLG